VDEWWHGGNHVLAEPPIPLLSQGRRQGSAEAASESLEWCKKSSVVNVFITTVDKKTVRIYRSAVEVHFKYVGKPGEHSKDRGGLARSPNITGEENRCQGLLSPRAATLLGWATAVYLEHLKAQTSTPRVLRSALQIAETNLDDKVETVEVIVAICCIRRSFRIL